MFIIELKFTKKKYMWHESMYQFLNLYFYLFYKMEKNKEKKKEKDRKN